MTLPWKWTSAPLSTNYGTKQGVEFICGYVEEIVQTKWFSKMEQIVYQYVLNKLYLLESN